MCQAISVANRLGGAGRAPAKEAPGPEEGKGLVGAKLFPGKPEDLGLHRAACLLRPQQICHSHPQDDMGLQETRFGKKQGKE